MNISFRLMVSNDLSNISLWQSTPEVKQWYGKEYTSREQIEKHYQDELKETPRLTWHYIIQLDDADAGIIQTYLIDSYPDMDKYMQVGEGAAMVDVFLASAFMHKGYGCHIMKAFLINKVFSGELFLQKNV